MRHANKVTPGNAVKRVTRGTNLTINLEPTTDARVVKAVEQALVRPRIRSGMETVIG
jgi:hypothetical protein